IRDMPQLLRLGGNRLDRVRMAVAERGDGDAAGEVEKFAAIGGVKVAAFAPFDGNVPPAIGRHDSWNHGKLSCAMNGGKTCATARALSSSPFRPRRDFARRYPRPADRAGIAHHRHSPRRDGLATPTQGASSRKARDYGDRSATCQFA